MRDALSLTDQAIAYAAGQVTLDAVQSMLGALDQSFLIRLLDALAQEDGTGLLAVADEMAARSLRSEEQTSELQSLMRISYAVFCLKKNKMMKKSSRCTLTIK